MGTELTVTKRVHGVFTPASGYRLVVYANWMSDPLWASRAIRQPGYPIEWGYSALTSSHAEFTQSISDPAWTTHKTARGLVAKRIENIDLKAYLRVPVKPVFNPPKWRGEFHEPTLKDVRYHEFDAPPRRFEESDEDYFKRIEFKLARFNGHLQTLLTLNAIRFQEKHLKWEASLEKLNKRRLDYDRTYKNRMIKYERRSAILEKRRDIVKNWQHRPRFVYVRPIGNLPDHDYTRIRMFSQVPMTFNYWVDPPSHGFWNPEYSNSYTQYFIPDNVEMDSLIEKALKSYDLQLKHILSEDIADLDSKCLRKLASKIRDGDLQVGCIIAERAQTLGMFRDAITVIVDLATGKKRLCRTVSHFLRNPRMIADNFLAFKFGLEPLLSDAHTLGLKLGQFVSAVDGEWLAFRANSRKFTTIRFEGEESAYEFRGVISVSYVAKYTVDSSSARYTSILGLVNPAEIAWELCPWSFVVDWLIPVSTWIQNLTYDVGLAFKTGTRKVYLQGTITNVGTADSGTDLVPYNPLFWSGPGSNPISRVDFEGAFESKVRTVLLSLPSISPPFLKDPLSTTHVLEALALSVQRLYRRH